MNWNQIKAKWGTVRDKVHSKWGKLTDADLSAIAGRREELVNRLAQRYSMDKAKAQQEADAFIKTLN